MTRPLVSGLVYVIATDGTAGALDEGQAVARALTREAGAEGLTREACAVAGTLWGWTPSSAQEAPGDRVEAARRGPLEAVLKGDPVWIEPAGSGPVTVQAALELWEEDPHECARSLDNLALLVVADGRSGEAHLITDRMGGVPLYTAKVRGVTVFSSSYTALSRILAERSIDGDSVAAFFHLGYYPGRRTAFEGLSLHPCGSWTRIRSGKVVTTPYWRPNMALVDADAREQARLAATAFETAVRESVAGFDRGLLAMTAGLDSRSIAAVFLEQKAPFEAYTHGFPGCWEVTRVKKIVQRHGIRHRHVPLVEDFIARLPEHAIESFRLSEGTISCIEKSHLVHVLGGLRQDFDARTAVVLGGGAGMLKGTFYRLLKDEPTVTEAGIDRYLTWNFTKRLPDIFAPSVPACERGPLHRFVAGALEEAGGGSFFQRLDYLYAVRYRRWAGGVKHIYRRFFPVREPFVAHHVLDALFPLDPRVKGAQLPHYEILSRNYAALQYDLTNKMTPALPFTWRTWPRFLPSIPWRSKQVIRGFSRRFLPRELFQLIDYVDYKRWIAEPRSREFVDGILDPESMRSAALYREETLRPWLVAQREAGYPAFPLIDKMCTLELYFREVTRP